jgi:nitric oxide reductase NorQ protein
MGQGVEPVVACDVTLIKPITDDADIRDALGAVVRACF